MKSHSIRVLSGSAAGIGLFLAGAASLFAATKGESHAVVVSPGVRTASPGTGTIATVNPQTQGASPAIGAIPAPSPKTQDATADAAPPVTVTAGPEPWYTIFGTAEAQGSIEHCGCPHNPGGGLPRRAGYLNLYRQTFKSSPVVWVDAGNWSDTLGSPGGQIKTRTLLSGMHDIGYTAANLSERDLDTGYPAFLERKKEAAFPLVSVNMVLQSNGKPIAEPYTIVTFEPKDYPALSETLKIAVAGVTRFNSTFTRPGPSDDKIVTAPPADELKKYMAEMRSKADQVIVLADMQENEAHDLARNVPGIDVIVAGYLALTKDVQKEGNTSIVYCGSQGKFLAELRAFKKEGATDLKSAMHYLSLNYPADPAMQAKIDTAQAEINRGGRDLNPGVNTKIAPR